MRKIVLPITIMLILQIVGACRKDEFRSEIVPSTWSKVTEAVENSDIKGFFLLNEGNMGSNKSTIDFFDYETGYYIKNIFSERNPSVARELGDVGNDIQIYGDKLYAVINCSNFIEVMDVNTAKHIAIISVPNCRYIVFDGGYAYVSSYAGPVQIDPNARLGYIAKIDTSDLRVVGTCVVGYQPEEMVIIEDKLYVANSGGYRVPFYDNTLSVIDLNTFTEIKKIEVSINLHRVKKDNYNNIYVSSRGDYYENPSKTFIIDTKSDAVSELLNSLQNSNMTIFNNHLYLYSTEWSYITNKNKVSYAKIDLKTKEIISRNFITDGTETNITTPYGIAVNPENGEFFITDAKNYVIPGTLYCFNPNGTFKWKVETGDIPAHIVFTRKSLKY